MRVSYLSIGNSAIFMQMSVNGSTVSMSYHLSNRKFYASCLPRDIRPVPAADAGGSCLNKELIE